MSTFKSYPKSIETPSRKSRKADRTKVFVFNKKLVKAARKVRRLERKDLASNEQ